MPDDTFLQKFHNLASVCVLTAGFVTIDYTCCPFADGESGGTACGKG